MVYFKEENHKYFDDNGDLWQSVSALVGNIKSKFDENAMPRYCAIKELFPDLLIQKKKKYVWDDPRIIIEIEKELSKSDLVDYFECVIKTQQQWALEAVFGTTFHKMKENQAIRRGYAIDPISGIKYKTVIPSKGEGYDNKYILDKVIRNYKENVYIPEAIIIDPETKTAGQADNLYLYYTGNSFIWNDLDYKTDKQKNLTRNPFYAQDRKGGPRYPKKFYYPFDDFYDTVLYYYTAKMSIYGQMLSNLDILPGNNALIHTPKLGSHKIINLPFYPNFAQRILDDKVLKKKFEYGEDKSMIIDKLMRA